MAFTVSAPVPIRFYQVRQNDSLSSICERHNISEESVRQENPEVASGDVQVGQMLVLRTG